MDITYVPRTRQHPVRSWIAYKLVCLAYSISRDAFEEFCTDNEWDFCPDCNGWRMK